LGWREHLKKLGYEPDVPMASKIAEWHGWYTASNDWYASVETSAATRRTYRVERNTIKPARMVAQEWASLMMNERTQARAADERADEWLQAWLAAVGFFASGQRLVERAFALGTGAWALRVSGIARDAAYSPGARIVAQRFDARHIVPLSYDEDGCTECAFVSQARVRGRLLDQVQMHLLGGDGAYEIVTLFFDDKGRPTELPGVMPRFSTRSAVPLFSLVSPGLENTYWDWSPFGVSIFDDALGAVKLTDAALDNAYRDIWLGQKMLFLDERMLERDAAGNVTVPRERDQQLFRKTELDTGATQMVEEYNPDLRVSDNRLALRTGLSLLGARCGMGADYFDFEEGSGLKTATEVISEQSDLFRNIRKHENALAVSITRILEGVLTLAHVLSGSVPEDPGEVSVLFDDSILEDTGALRKRDLEEVAAGLMQPFEYRVKWYGEDEATARAMTEAEGLPAPEL